MDFASMTFPLTIDVSGTQYWIGDEGPYKLGIAATEFLADEDSANGSLREELENCLRAFNGVFHSFADSFTGTQEQMIRFMQNSVLCTVGYGYHAVPGSIYLVERYTFTSLRDFLLVELGKGIFYGNSPRQCRLCGRWYFHEKGDRTIYCDRVAPGETERTCREVGARAVFEKKIQDEETWKIYKRAYKKYYARLMKGAMTQEEFKAWADEAAAERDKALRQLQGEKISEVLMAEIFRELREKLNRQ